MNNEIKHSGPPEDERDDNKTICKILLGKLEEILLLPKNRKLIQKIREKDKPKS